MYENFKSSHFSMEDLAKCLWENNGNITLFQCGVSVRALISLPSLDMCRVTPGLEMKYSFYLIWEGKIATSKWSRGKQFIKVGFESWKKPKGSKSDCPQSVCLKSKSGKAGDVLVYSRDRDPSLLLREHEATNSTRKAWEWANLAQRINSSISSLLLDSVNFKLTTYHVKAQGQTRKDGKGSQHKKTSSLSSRNLEVRPICAQL